MQRGAVRQYPRTARVNEVVREVLADELERMYDPRLGSRDDHGRRRQPPICARRPSTTPRSVRPDRAADESREPRRGSATPGTCARCWAGGAVEVPARSCVSARIPRSSRASASRTIIRVTSTTTRDEQGSGRGDDARRRDDDRAGPSDRVDDALSRPRRRIDAPTRRARVPREPRRRRARLDARRCSTCCAPPARGERRVVPARRSSSRRTTASSRASTCSRRRGVPGASPP